MTYKIVPITSEYRAIVDSHIAKNWAGPFVISRGTLHDTRTQQGFVAVFSDEVVGYIVYNVADGGCEIIAIESLHPRQGIGATLIDAIMHTAKKEGCSRIWLVTTNDNTPAMRFYQRYGFVLKAVRLNAMKENRLLKPQIPLVGIDDVPIAHEFEFEMFV